MTTTYSEPPEDEQVRCNTCEHWTFIPDDFDYPTPYSEGKCSKYFEIYNYTSYGGWCDKWEEVK